MAKFYSIKPCRFCGSQFQPTGSRSEHCSRKCAVTAKGHCRIDGCTRNVHLKRMCLIHYQRVLRYGDPSVRNKPGVQRRSLKERFDLKYRIDKNSGCWLWRGASAVDGRGRINSGGGDGPTLAAHRAAYELYIGPIPVGLHVCHHCDNPPCCNPHHLFLGTHKDNMADCASKGRTSKHPRPKGEANYMAKLTEKAVLEIRSSADTNRVLGKRYGVSHAAIGYVKRRAVWRHI